MVMPNATSRAKGSLPAKEPYASRVRIKKMANSNTCDEDGTYESEFLGNIGKNKVRCGLGQVKQFLHPFHARRGL